MACDVSPVAMFLLNAMNVKSVQNRMCKTTWLPDHRNSGLRQWIFGWVNSCETPCYCWIFANINQLKGIQIFPFMGALTNCHCDFVLTDGPHPPLPLKNHTLCVPYKHRKNCECCPVSGNKDCHQFRFSIVRIVISASTVKSSENFTKKY